MLDKISIVHSTILAEMHRHCFEKNWNKKAFDDLLSLPATVGVISEAGFILASHISETLEIITFCVLPEYRCRGEGNKLLNELIFNTSPKDIFLEVNCQNIPAISFYKKNYFIEVGRRKGYYDGVDAIVYKRIIK